jgi:hypothetical protein
MEKWKLEKGKIRKRFAKDSVAVTKGMLNVAG